VKAVIYTHSHMDHFGGVKGVIDVAAVRAGRVPVIAPLNFIREAIVENVTAGNAMQRRTAYYSGAGLPKDAQGSVDAGLGAAVAVGTASFIAPTDEIRSARDTRVVDGVKIEFTQASNTEAPSEMVLYFPQFKVLDMAETAAHTVHNLLTPRGAQVRSAEAWSAALNDALDRYGARSEALIGQHHWPSWGQEAITRHLRHQRDFYRFVRDAALHLANQGDNMDEIGEKLVLPAELARDWSLQDYYGTLRGAGKAVFQYYLGWYDGNPSNLQRLPPVEAARRYIRYMGGADAVIARARQDFEAGDYRWVTEVLNHVIFAEPGNEAAKDLQARSFEQLGYQQVSATWRNLYLVAAQELRAGGKGLARRLPRHSLPRRHARFAASGFRWHCPAPGFAASWRDQRKSAAARHDAGVRHHRRERRTELHRTGTPRRRCGAGVDERRPRPARVPSVDADRCARARRRPGRAGTRHAGAPVRRDGKLHAGLPAGDALKGATGFSDSD
jgi:alkyl sulfatase BDS1-like metallo-beta-lactamase superfamily hydrolase